MAAVFSHPIQYYAPWQREIARRGDIDLRVFYCCDLGVRPSFDRDFGQSFSWDIPLLDGYEHEFLPIRRRPQKLTVFTIDNPDVGAAMARWRPDVVLLNGYQYRTYWRAAAWARRERVPVLLASDSNAARKRPWYVQLAKEVVVRRFYSYVDGAFAICGNNRDYHAHFGIPEHRIFPGMIPIDRKRLLAAVPDREFTRRDLRQRYGIPQNAFLVVWCGKFIPIKRPLDLLEAVRRVSGSPQPVWASLVGDGPERPTLEAWLRENAVKNVVLTGFQNQSAIPSCYAAADALAVTSSVEAYGIVVTEGASYGLPVLASDQIGCVGDHDTARPGANALVYPCGDVAALAAAIDRLRSDTALYAVMSKTAVEISKSNDVGPAADALAAAAIAIVRLGKR